MRIAINHTRWSTGGGVERFLHLLAEHLVSKGHEVHFYASRQDAEIPPGVLYHSVPRVRGFRTWRVLGFALLSRRLLAREHYDVVLGTGKTIHQDVVRDGSGSRKAYDDAMERPLLSRLSPGRLAQLWIDRRKYSPGAYRAIVAISGFVRDQIVRDYGVPAESVTVIHNGADTVRFSPEKRRRLRTEVRAELGIAPADEVALLVASNLERKGAGTLLHALTRTPRPRLVVVGDDGTIERYRHLARELDVAGRALFLGRRTDVDRLHAAADVFALPSRFDAIANATLEALASGLPVVVSRQDGIAEIVEPAGCGIVVQDPRDAGEVARALTTLGDPGRREAMGRAARRAAEEISVERQMDRYVELFERVARQGAPR